MLNHIWNLFTKAGSLWVAWIESNWLRGRSLWSISIPSSCSWSWKKLLKLRDMAKSLIRFQVGDGRNIFLWLDHWHPAGCLLGRFGYRAVYDSGMSINAKLSAIIHNGEWFWPAARSDDLVEIQCQLLDINLGGEDQPIWESKNGKYSCAETWERLRSKNQVVHWWKSVWFSMAIPRHSFFLWLVFRDAVVTRQKMCSWGYMGPCLCLFCYAAQENRNHLFFSCSFSRRIWKTIMGDCFFADVPTSWDEVEVWGPKVMRGKSLQSCLGKICFAAVVYHLWKQRTALLHSNNQCTEEAILAQISWEVRARIMNKGQFKGSDKQLALVAKWNLFSLV